MSAAWFEFRSVSKDYDGRAVLSDVSFTIPAGDHTAILGPSGCGKSTLLRLLAGLDTPSAGQIMQDGDVVSEAHKVVKPPHRRGVAMVFQNLALWPNLSVTDNVLLGLSGAGLTKREAKTRVDEALLLCAIAALAERKPGALSGGQQQRVALARAIAVRPSYCLLDEPFSGLDLVTKTTLLNELAVLAAERKITVLLVTHDLLEATTLCRSAIVLNNGRIEEIGTLETLLQSSRSEMFKIFREYRGGAQVKL